MNADQYVSLVGTIASALLVVTDANPAWAGLAKGFITLAAPMLEMIETGRDPTPAERQALVDYRHKLSAELQAINTSERG